MSFSNNHKINRDGTQFVGRYGMFLNKMVAVVIANRKFIAVVPVDGWSQESEFLLDPTNPLSGEWLVAAPGWLAKKGIEFVVPMEEFQ